MTSPDAAPVPESTPPVEQASTTQTSPPAAGGGATVTGATVTGAAVQNTLDDALEHINTMGVPTAGLGGPKPPLPDVLKVYQTGPLTVVGFAGKDVPDEVCIARYRDTLFQLIADHHVETMAFDLTGVGLVPSGMLGVLTSVRKRVSKVELYNPSADVQDVLRITNLAQMFEVKQVDM